MPFTPLDSQAIFSTVFLEGPLAWAVWTAILSTMDSDGSTTISPRHLAVVWRMDEAEVQKAWDIHASPDPHSKNKEHEGRRIIPTHDGRWLVVSHAKYREMYSKEYRASRMREAKRRQRAKDKGLNVDCAKCGEWVANPGDEVCPKCAFEIPKEE